MLGCCCKIKNVPSLTLSNPKHNKLVKRLQVSVSEIDWNIVVSELPKFLPEYFCSIIDYPQCDRVIGKEGILRNITLQLALNKRTDYLNLPSPTCSNE
jgi:hypothetical protein